LFLVCFGALGIWVGSGTNNLVHSTNLLPCMLIFSHGFWELELFMWTIFLHVGVVLIWSVHLCRVVLFRL
jgi:hypothetical protein